MPAAPTRARPLLLMTCAVALFALMDAGLKLLAPHYPPLQVGALRAASSLPFIAIWLSATVGWRGLWRVRWPLHLLRAGLGIAMMAGFVYGLRTLPLSTAYAITFVAPLLIAALSVPVLGERVGPRRWVAIGVGLLGVLVILRPTGAGMLTAGGLAILGAAVCYAVSAITVRVLGRSDSTQAMVFWLMLLMALGSGLLAWKGWTPIRAQDLWVIAGVGVAGSIAQVALTEAFRHGEASLVAPLEYTALVWGTLLDLALWRVLPDGVTWIGAAIIVASGLYLMRRERLQPGRASAAARDATPP